MQSLTLTFAIIISLLVIIFRPAYAMAAYIISLLWYPPFLAVRVGTIDILLGRFVVAVLLLRCLWDDRIRGKFIWCSLDKVVGLSMIVFVVPYFITSDQSVSSVIENRGGFLMDTFFAYMAARFILTDRKRLVSVIKCIGVALVPLTILGMIECITGWQPFAVLRVFSPWFAEGRPFVSQGRFGFARAVGPFSHAILFGGGFAMFLPLIYYLRHEKGDWRTFAYVLSGIAVLGAFSSLSSGPWVMIIAVIFCLFMEKHRQFVKPLFLFLVFSCIFIGIASNRPFYHVIASWANPLGGAGYHRARLIDLAVEHFNEWWVAGYGMEDPGWGPVLGMSRTDVTNEFILAGVRYGILGIIALCLIIMTAFNRIISTYRRALNLNMKSLCWAFGSLLFSVVVCWMSVSFFGQLLPLFYFCLGTVGSITHSNFNWQIPNRVTLLRNRSVHAANQLSAV